MQGLSYRLALQDKPLFNGALTDKLRIGANYDLKLADATLLRGRSTQPLLVDAHGNQTMMLNMAVDYARIGSIAQRLRSANSLPIELVSQMKVPGLKGETVVPYNWKGSVPLIH